MLEKVAVYGTLKQGFHNNRLLKDCTYEGSDVLEGYVMLDLGGCPIVYKTDNDEDIVYIEVFKDLTKDVLESLDRLEGYREDRDPAYNLYNRMEVMTNYGKAYIYEYYLLEQEKTPWIANAKVENGCWMERPTQQFLRMY